MHEWHTPQLTDLGSVADAQAGLGLGGDLSLLAS